MTQQNTKISPQLYARICGVLYLYILMAASFAELFVRAKQVVSTDAAATAGNIMSNESLFRLGFSGELLHVDVRRPDGGAAGRGSNASAGVTLKPWGWFHHEEG